VSVGERETTEGLRCLVHNRGQEELQPGKVDHPRLEILSWDLEYFLVNVLRHARLSKL